jgi:type I restriction enzyme, S subunit
MNILPLGEICKINPSLPQRPALNTKCSFVSMENVDDVTGKIARKQVRYISEVQKGYTPFQNGDVLFAKITPCMENGKCAIAANLVNGIGYGSTEFHVMRAERNTIPEWIFYYLRQERIRGQAERRMTGSAGQKRVPTLFLEELPIPAPAVDEQKRIVTELNKADRLRLTCLYTQQLIDTFLSSVFLEIFGDPFNNPKGWNTPTIETLLSTSRTGTQTGPFGSSLKRHEYVKTGIPVWGINNVHPNEFVEQDSLFITSEKYNNLTSYSVEAGDILISRAGTVGRMCVAYPRQHPSIIGTNLVRVSLNISCILPEYFVALFTYFPERVGHLRMSHDENAYSFLNPTILKTLEIPVPPISTQKRFVAVVNQQRHIQALSRETNRQAEHLFQTLLHQAFLA